VFKGGSLIVKFCVLASGSSGNAALLATDKTRILVDAGLSMKELAKRLASIGESLETLDAILITHEHSDHVSGLPVLARNKRIAATIYMTRLTAPAIDWGETKPRLEPFQAGARLRIGDIDVQSFGIPHDAIDPVGFAFEARRRTHRRGHRSRLHPRIHQVSPAAHRLAAARSQSRSRHAEGGALIPRYTRPEMGAVWSDQNKFQQWLEVELAARRRWRNWALCRRKTRCCCGGTLLRRPAHFRNRKEVKHDVIAFTTAVAESMAAAGHAEASRWFHYGMTSNDVVDTAQALQLDAGVGGFCWRASAGSCAKC
jgi:hypothetical protein